MASAKQSHGRAWYLVLMCLAGLSGCGGGGRETVAVRGTVTLDGQPLADAAVMFSGPEGESPATTRTDSNGSFTINAVVGANDVAVAKVQTSGDGGAGDDGTMPASGAVSAQSILPSKYSNFQTSGLNVEVAQGMGDVKLELVSQ